MALHPCFSFPPSPPHPPPRRAALSVAPKCPGCGAARAAAGPARPGGERLGGWRGPSSPPSLPRLSLLPETLMRAVCGSRAGPAGSGQEGIAAADCFPVAMPGGPERRRDEPDCALPLPRWPDPCPGGLTPGTHTQRQRSCSHPGSGGVKESAESQRAACLSWHFSLPDPAKGRGWGLEKWVHVGV